MKMKRFFYAALGFLFFGLGAIGAFLPVLPTTPFLLLASGCFLRSSPRFNRWFTGTKLYRRHLGDFVEHRAMTLGTKLGIVLPVTAIMGAVFVMVGYMWARVIIVLAMLFKYYYFAFRIKTIPRTEPEAVETTADTP